MADSRGLEVGEGESRVRASSQPGEGKRSRMGGGGSGGTTRLKTLSADDLLERLHKATRAFLVAHENDETMHIASRDPPSLRICEVMCEIFQHGLALHHSLFWALRSHESEVDSIFATLWDVLVTAFPQPLIQDIKDLGLESERPRCYVWFRKNIGSFGTLLTEIATPTSSAHAVIHKRYKGDAFLRDMEKVGVAAGFCTMLSAYTFNLAISDLLVRPASPPASTLFRKRASSHSRVVKAQAPKDVAPENTALGKDWSNVAVDTSTVLKVQSPKLKRKKKKKKTTSTLEGRAGPSARAGSFSLESPDVQSPAGRRSPTADGAVFTYGDALASKKKEKGDDRRGSPGQSEQDKQASRPKEGPEEERGNVSSHTRRASAGAQNNSSDSKRKKKNKHSRGSSGKGISRQGSNGDSGEEHTAEVAAAHRKPRRELSFADSLSAAFEAEQTMLSGKTSPSKQQQEAGEEGRLKQRPGERKEKDQENTKSENVGEAQQQAAQQHPQPQPQQQRQRQQGGTGEEGQVGESGSAMASAASNTALCDWMIVQAEGSDHATAYPTTTTTTSNSTTAGPLASDGVAAVHTASQSKDAQQQQQQHSRQGPHEDNTRSQQQRQQQGESVSSLPLSTPRSPGSVSQASIMVHQRPEFAQDDIARDMSHYLFHVGAHIGMCAQVFRCWECNAPISPEGRPFMCRFTGKFFCSSCHHRYRTLVPGRLLHDWDNNHYEVCDNARDYITRILDNNFTFDLREVQPILIEHVPAVEDFMDARKDFYVCFKAMSTCSQAKLSNITYYLGSRPHFMSSPALVSFKDLDEVKSGKLTKLVTWANGVMRAHTDSCELCQDKILHGTHKLLELEASVDA